MTKHGEQKQNYPNSTKSVYHPFVAQPHVEWHVFICVKAFSLLSCCSIYNNYKQIPSNTCQKDSNSATTVAEGLGHVRNRSNDDGTANPQVQFTRWCTWFVVADNLIVDRTVCEITTKIMICIFRPSSYTSTCSHAYTYSHDNYTYTVLYINELYILHIAHW